MRGLDQIRRQFAPGISDDELVRFVGLVFSKTFPAVHYEFVSDGFHLEIIGPKKARTIVINELPECFQGYDLPWRKESYKAALNAVRALLDWRIISFRGMSKQEQWSAGPTGGGDYLINGELYQWIKGIGEFGYCRTRNVIEFIYAAAPELRTEWEAMGLTLAPRYHVNHSGGGRFTTLRLVPQSPA